MTLGRGVRLVLAQELFLAAPGGKQVVVRGQRIIAASYNIRKGSAFRLWLSYSFSAPDAVRLPCRTSHLQRVAYLHVHLPGRFTLRVILVNTAPAVTVFREILGTLQFYAPADKQIYASCRSIHTWSVGAL